MNNDLISREALIKALNEAQVEFDEYYKGLGKAKVITNNAPTVEPKQGEWIVTAEDNDGVHRICCPFCSYEKGSNNTDTVIVTFHNFPKFCENCGADMRKGGAE